MGATRSGGRTSSPTAPTRSTSSRSCRSSRRSSATGTHVLDIGTGEGQLARHLRAAGVDRVTGIDPSANQLRVAVERGRRTGVRTRARRPRCRSRTRPSTAWSRASCSSTSRRSTRRSPRWRACSRPGGVFLFLLNHPLLQAPGSGWIDDHILEEQYWRIGPYLVESFEEEEIAPGVHLPFIHRPMSRYVNTLAANGLLVHRMLEPAPPPGFLARAVEYAEPRRRSRGSSCCARSVTELALRPEARKCRCSGHAEVRARPDPGRHRRCRLRAGQAPRARPTRYDITDSGRLGWSLAYVGVLLLAAYAVGLPSLPAQPQQAARLGRRRRARRDPDVGRDPRWPAASSSRGS